MSVVPFEPRHAVEVAQRDTVDGWVTVVREVAILADQIAATPFVPSALQGKPAAVTAAILAGRELGLGPMQSLANVHVIDGRPAVSAEIARGLALAQGHDIVVTETSTTRCVVRGRRRGGTEWVTVSWSMDDAKRAGLLGRTNWQKHPRRMLQARATSELCHLLFADAIGGMPYTVEEAQDDTDVAGHIDEAASADVGEKPTPAASGRRTAQRRSRAAATPSTPEPAEMPPAAAETPDGPPLPGEDGYEPVDPTVPGSISKDQLTKLHTVLTKHGISDRDEKLDIARRVLRQPDLASSTDLSLQDASTLIDTLERAGQHEAGFSGYLAELLAATETADQSREDTPQ